MGNQARDEQSTCQLVYSSTRQLKNIIMKLRYLFTAIISALLFVSCSEDNEPAGNLGSISLSETYVSLPTEGGSATVAVSATQDWKFENVIFSSETGKTQLVTTKDTVDAWFTVSHVSGTAGQSELVFSADAFEGGREVELQINVGGNTQFLMVRQGTAKAVMATCAEVLAGTDGKTYKIKGTCTSIANTTYGNWYINDGTGEVYIYGTLDSKGATKNFASWGLEVGDVVELEGPRTTYGSTVELVDVTIIKITKSLVKVVTESANIAKEGGELEVKVAFKGNGAYVSVPEECQSWVHLANTEYVAGEATKIEPNPADTAVFTFNIMANEAGARTGSMEFTSGTSTVSYTFSQEGAIANVTVAEFLAAQVGDAQYRVTGVVDSIANTKYGNIFISDWTGRVYVYGTTNFADCNIAVGSMVTLVGPRAEYKGTAQMKNAVCEEVLVASTPVSITEFNALDDSNDKFYMVSGTISKIANDLYGNIYIVDETGAEMYIYGTYGIWNAQGDDKKNFVATAGLAVGDKITVVGIKTSYKDSPQMKNGCCVAIEKAQ